MAVSGVQVSGSGSLVAPQFCDGHLAVMGSRQNDWPNTKAGGQQKKLKL